MSNEPACYRVVVRSNLVVSVEPVAALPDHPIAATPLEVSSILASNHRTNACLDGIYHVPDADMARQVATLSLDFIEKIIAKSIVSLSAATLYPNGWHNPFTGHVQKPA
jgi:hypothetical protein